MNHRLTLALKRSLIRAVQSARTVKGRQNSHWVRRFYALLAPIYDRTFLMLPGYRDSATDLIARLGVQGGQSIMDVGCGTGLLTLPLAERGGRVVALDLSPAMLQKLSAQVADRGLVVDTREGSALNLPAAKDVFAHVTTAFMLLYLTQGEKQQALTEMRRVLIPGGRLGCLSSRGEISDVFLTRAGWQELLHGAGFVRVQITDCYDIFRLITAEKPLPEDPAFSNTSP